LAHLRPCLLPLPKITPYTQKQKAADWPT